MEDLQDAGALSQPPHLHHVGIVVPYEEHAARLMTLLGLDEAYRGYVEAYKAECIFTVGHGGSPLELVVPRGGVLVEFNRGVGGLHHIALAVPDIRQKATDLAARGIELLEREPVRGAGNFLCNFLPPAQTRGVIVEFIEDLD